MNFNAELLGNVRKEGYSDDEIWDFVASQDERFKGAKQEGYSLDEVADYFSKQEPVGTSVGQEVSQLGAALKSGIAQPLQAMGVTAETLGFPEAGAALKGAVEQPEGYVPAAQRFMEPQAGEAQLGGFAFQYLPRAIVEQVGQLGGSIASRAAGGVIGGLVGSVVPGKGTAVGAGIGMFTGPALFEAAQIVGPVAQERAKNNNREIPNSEDLAYAWTTAGTSGALNALGAKYLPGGEKAVGALTKRIAASFLGEAATEGAQALTQQVGETVLTEKGLEIKPKSVLGEALIGGVSAGGATIVMSPLQKEQVDIEKEADIESRDLSVPVDDPEVRANLDKANILEQENKDSLAIINKFGVESEEGKAAQQTIVDNTDEITKINETLPATVSLPITTAEQQQIELARAITTPVEEKPATPKPLPTDVLPTETPSATYGREEQVYDVFGGITRKPVSIPKLAELPAAPTIEEQTAERTYGGETGIFDVFAGARRKPVVTEEPPVSMVGKEVIPGVTPVPVASAQPKATKEDIASATNVANQIEEENKVLEKLTKFNPPSAPTLQDARSLPDAVAKKGKSLSISGGKQEKNILDPKESKKRFDDIGYERQELELPEDLNDRVSGRYGNAIANIKSLYSLQWLGAHFHGGVAVSPNVKGTQRGRIVAHELGHASHSLLGDQINKDQNVLNELKAIEELLYPGLRAKVSTASNPDASFFNYLLSSNELIAEFNVERVSNPERAAQVAPALSALLESAEKMKGLVADRKTFPTFMGAIGESKERLKVKDLESRRIKETTKDELAFKYKQWSEESKWILRWGKEGKLKNLESAKTALSNLSKIDKAPKSFAKRTAELTENQELIDYVEELYSAPTEPTVKESLTVAQEAPAITPTPVAETPAIAPAPEVAPATWIAPEQKLTPQESKALQVANLKGTEKRTGNITFVPEKLMTPQRLQSLRTEKESSGPLKDFPRGGKFIEIKMMADVTGDPNAKGWAIIDRRPDLNRREWIAQIPNRDERILAGSIANNESEKIVSAIKDGSITQERSNQLVDEAVNNQIISSDFANNLRTAISNSTPAVSETIIKPKLGEKGGVLIPSREDFIQAGQNIYEAGMEFKAWAKQMIQRFGDTVRQFLGDVWEAVSGFPAKLEEMAGYLPGKGERGAVTFGMGEEPPKKPAEEKPAMERYKGKAQVAGVPGIGAVKDTPKAINKKTETIIRERVFDSAIVTDNQTNKAWNLIQRLEKKNKDAGKNAQAINELTRETMQDVEAEDVVKQSIGAVKLRNELYSYAIKLAGQGDTKMLNYLLNTSLVVGSGDIVEGDAGRILQAMSSLKTWIIRATEAEQTGFFNIAAQQFFGTKTPTDEQVQKIQDIFNKVKEVKIDQEKELMTELEEVGKAAGVDLPAIVQKQIETAPRLDPMVVAMTSMQKLYGGTITTQYEPISKKAQGRFEGVKKIIQGGITNYRQKIVSKAANGLETGFWKTLASTENKPGPLGELDSAQNRALANIVKQSLVAMGLKGTPPDTKMSIYEQVASILNEQPLSKDKIKMADDNIRGTIESKREAELENASEDQQDAINLKYDQITLAWDDSMSRMLDIPVSETMLRRMILNELKESDTSVSNLATLMDEEPAIGTSRQDRLVNSIIEKVTGVTFDGQPTRDYTNLKTYLSDLLDMMVVAEQQKNRAAKTISKVRKESAGDADKQAQAQIDKLAKIQADPTIFGEKKIDPVRNAVRDALSLELSVGFTPAETSKIKTNWKGAFVADPNKKGIPTSFMLEMQRLGVNEAAADTLAEIVWRQIEVNAMNRQIDATTKAVEAGPIGGIVQAILNTPLANQQDPEWRKNIILDYLKNAGVKPNQAENIAKLFDVSLRKRFAKAQEEAAIKAAKSIKGGLNANSKRALEKFLKAIRAQVLDPGKDVAKAFAEEMGWKGFTSEQIVKLNELDAIVNDTERTDAERAVAIEQIQQIIDKVSMPPQIKEMIASFYIGNALMRFPTFGVQAIDPLAMTAVNTAIESIRNVTNPLQFIQTWANYGRAISNLFRESAYSYKNDVLRSGRMIDYMENEDRKSKRLWNEAVNKWKRGDIRGAIKDGLFGYTAFTFRTLKALDDGAYSLLISTTLPQYVEAALKNAKIPREKRRGVMRQVLHAREMDIEQMVSKGIPKNDAVIYANERMQAAITKELSGLNIDAQEVINSAINDSLARIGKTRFVEDILTGKIEEIKDLGTISAPFLRWYESVSKAVSSKGSESQKIFYRILLGFPLIPARIFNIAAGYTPLTIYRHALKGRYQLTYGTALQRRQRLAEQLAGTMVLLPLLALRSNSLDEEDEKEKGFGIYITGQGPSKMKDKTLHAKWNDRHDPYSLEFRMGGKTKFSIDAKAAGPLSVMIYLLGAMDDWETNRKLDKLKTTKDDWKNAEDNASLLTSLYDLAGYAVLTTARRGPTTGVMQGLVDFRRFPDDPIAAIGADVAFSALPAVPLLGTGIAKNLSDFLSQPIDNTTKEGAILSNIPVVGPMLGKPALNSYGQKMGELRFSEKLKKSFGVPFTLVVSDNEEDNKLTGLTLKFGNGPTPLQRTDIENYFKEAITDDEWYLAAKTFGDRNRSYVLKNYEKYSALKQKGFDSVMSDLTSGSKMAAIKAVKNKREKTP